MKAKWLILCGLLLSLTGCALGAAPSKVGTETAAERTVERENYTPRKVNGTVHLVWDWQPEDGSVSQLLEQEKLPGINVVSPKWFEIADENGRIANKNGDIAYVEKAHAKGYIVWPLITNGFNPDRTRKLLHNPTARQQVVQQLLSLCKTMQLDGINLDFENIHPEDRKRLTDFVGEIAEALHTNNLTVSIDVTIPSSNGNWSRCYDRGALSAKTDYVMLMAYDEHYRKSKIAGSVASLPWVEAGVQATLAEKVPKEKLVLGMPLYMRDWTIDKSGQVSAKTLSMSGAEQLLKEKTLVPQWLPDKGQYYFSYTDEKNQQHQVWQEESRSLLLKAALVSRYDLAGSCYWRKGLETPDVWSKLAAVMP